MKVVYGLQLMTQPTVTINHKPFRARRVKKNYTFNNTKKITRSLDSE